MQDMTQHHHCRCMMCGETAVLDGPERAAAWHQRHRACCRLTDTHRLAVLEEIHEFKREREQVIRRHVPLCAAVAGYEVQVRRRVREEAERRTP